MITYYISFLNRTVASLVLTSQIVIRNENNSTSLKKNLTENATLEFELKKVSIIML